MKAADPSGGVFPCFPLRVDNGIRIEGRGTCVCNAVSELCHRHKDDDQGYVGIGKVGCDQDDRHSEKGDNGSRSGGNLFRHIFCQVGANDTQDIGDQDVPCQQTGILCHICKIVDGDTGAYKVKHPFGQVCKQ